MPSTVIAQIDYNPDTRILRITYTSGEVYAYYDVPDSIYISLMQSRSKGYFLNKAIKGTYDYKKLT
jgi:hypothetical protein